MNLKHFIAGNYIQRNEYKSFEPEPINHTWIWEDPEINVLLERANKFLGELNAFSFIIPDVDLYIAMHILKEATQSSKIEGTKTDID
jgi:Fic/DOC family N-terminal